MGSSVIRKMSRFREYLRYVCPASIVGLTGVFTTVFVGPVWLTGGTEATGGLGGCGRMGSAAPTAEPILRTLRKNEYRKKALDIVD
jgi:hypothetical protein